MGRWRVRIIADGEQKFVLKEATDGAEAMRLALADGEPVDAKQISGRIPAKLIYGQDAK